MEHALQRYGSYEKFEKATGGNLLTESRILDIVKKYMEREGCLGEVRGQGDSGLYLKIEMLFIHTHSLIQTQGQTHKHKSDNFHCRAYTHSQNTSLRCCNLELVFLFSCTLQSVSCWICTSSLQSSTQQGIKVNELQGQVRPYKKPPLH